MILVIGSSGHIARALARRDPTLTFAGRPNTNLVNAQSLRDICAGLRPVLVINAGAYTAVDAAETDRDTAFAINATGAGALAEATASIGAPLLHVSTDYVFDGEKRGPYTEEDTPDPINVYGASKLAGERAVRDANPRSLIVRTSWVHSPNGKSFVSAMLQRAQGASQIEVVNDQYGSPSFADDVAENLLAIARSVLAGNEAWGTYHLAGDGAASRFDFAQAIFADAEAHKGPRATLIPVTSDRFPTPARRPANTALNCTKSERVFGARMPPWREGIERCVASIAANGW